MNSGTSTKRRPAPGGANATAASMPASSTGETEASGGIRPWQLFVLVALAGASVVVFASRGQHLVAVLLLSGIVFGAAWAAMTVLKVLAPLVSGEESDAPEMLGGRTRAALEREKTLALRSIKELEFDRAMGKVSTADFDEMAARLRSRALRLMQQLDQGSGYREIIERELEKRIGAAPVAAPREPACQSCAAENDHDARFCKRCGTRLASPAGTGSPVVPMVLLALLVASSAFAQMGMGGGAMPDLGQMAGQPIPVGDLPIGTVTVRVVRQQMTNVVPNQEVELQVGNEMRSAKTDETGRATFSGLTPGQQVRAFTQVDGEKLMSVPFDVGTTGGTRVLLAAGLAEAAAAKQKEAEAAAQAAPVKGTVVIGATSQIVFEFQDDAVSVFYMLDIVNTARAPVDLGQPLMLDMPRGAIQTSLLDESTKQASVSGTRVIVRGPFAPGRTSVQVAYRWPDSGGTIDFRQMWPVATEGMNIVIQKIGDMQAESAQFGMKSDRDLPAGRFIVATGAPIAAGQAFEMTITGLPHHATWPRTLALASALAVILLGVWLGRGPGRAEAIRAQLQSRRDRLFNELVKLEEQHRAGRVDAAAYEHKRHALVQQLERIYGELDAGGEGLAA